MEKIISSLEKLQQINSKYDLANDGVERLIVEAKQAKVCMPVIGKFSTGKSALVNTLLDYNKILLKEDITPETAVPVEITYSNKEESAILCYADGNSKTCTVDEFRTLKTDANKVDSVRLLLNNENLENIKDVMLVDMPGFESGIEVHNKAIDNYLPRSLAYILTFAADEMVLKASMKNLLKELCLYDMPVCVAITKCDKKDGEFEESLAYLKKEISKVTGNREVPYCFTSSRDGDIGELRDYLNSVEKQSQTILHNYYRKFALVKIVETKGYFDAFLKNSELSLSELDEQYDAARKQLDDNLEKLNAEKQEFDSKIQEVLEEIKGDVATALRNSESMMVSMALNKQDIANHVNTLIRSTLSASVQRRLVPVFEKYVKKVQSGMDEQMIGDIPISLNVDLNNQLQALTASVVGTLSALALKFLGPIYGTIASVVLSIVAYFVSSGAKESQREEVRRKIREIQPQILTAVDNVLIPKIQEMVDSVNKVIAEKVEKDKAIKEKAINDLRAKIDAESQEKADRKNAIMADMKELDSMKAAM